MKGLTPGEIRESTQGQIQDLIQELQRKDPVQLTVVREYLQMIINQVVWLKVLM